METVRCFVRTAPEEVVGLKWAAVAWHLTKKKQQLTNISDPQVYVLFTVLCVPCLKILWYSLHRATTEVKVQQSSD